MPNTTQPPNRLDEHDADYRRLHTATLARLQSSIAQYARELRRSDGDGHRANLAASRFIARHTALLRDAYTAGWREGQRDYAGAVSLARDPDMSTPSDEQAGRRLAFYAPSVAKMAAEGLRAYQETTAPIATVLRASERDTGVTYLLADGDALSEWQQGVSHRLVLQAEVTWPALHDGYAAAGASDPAAPFSHLWWELGPVKTEHCADCPWMAYNSPYDPPGSGGNELAQTPGDGRTECGAGCKCSLRYGDWMLPEDTDWAQYYFPPDAPMRNQPANPGLFPETVMPWPTPLPVAVDRAGNYVYPDTPEEERLRAERAAQQAHQAGLRVEPIPLDQAELTASQKAALDQFRAAWRKWDRVRGDRPAARSLFGYVWNAQTGAFQVSQSQATLVPRSSGYQVQDEAFARSWADLTPGQQRALVALWYAIVAWDAAVATVGAPQPEAQLAEAMDADATVRLYSPEQERDSKGRFEDEGAPSKSEGHPPAGHTSGRLATAREKMLARSEAVLAQRVNERIATARQIPRYEEWLAAHGREHPKYDAVSAYHARLLTHFDALSEEIEARERALGRPATPRPRVEDLQPAAMARASRDAKAQARRERLRVQTAPARAARQAAQRARRQGMAALAKSAEPDYLVEPRQATVRLGGHEPGYTQNRDNKGRWAPGDSGQVTWKNEHVRQGFYKTAGRELSDAEVAHLAGARAGATVRVGSGSWIYVEHPDGYRHSAVLVRDSETGKTYIYNNDFSTGELDANGIGDTRIPFDPRVLATQVMAARRVGIDTISTKSRVRSRDAQELPHLGYDTTMRRALSELPGGVLAQPPHPARMVSDLLKTDEGRKWWDENASNPSFDFDTREGSRSSQMLDAYLREHYGQGLEDFG